MAYYAAKGFTLNVDSVSVGSVTSIGGVEVTTDTEETTAVTDSAGYKTYMGTLCDGGEVALEGICDTTDAGQTSLQDNMDNGEAVDCEIVFPSAMALKWTFDAIVTKYKIGEASGGGLMKWSATLKISGKPTLAAVSNGG